MHSDGGGWDEPAVESGAGDGGFSGEESHGWFVGWDKERVKIDKKRPVSYVSSFTR